MGLHAGARQTEPAIARPLARCYNSAVRQPAKWRVWRVMGEQTEGAGSWARIARIALVNQVDPNKALARARIRLAALRHSTLPRETRGSQGAG